jgi:hypothetical protein
MLEVKEKNRHLTIDYNKITLLETVFIMSNNEGFIMDADKQQIKKEV